MQRRDFLRHSLTGLGILGLGVPGLEQLTAVSPESKFSAFDTMALPNSTFQATRLALGSGSSGIGKASNQTRMGIEKFIGMVRYGYERGVNFWDMADQYGSHPFFHECLKFVPREKVAILTKTNAKDAARMQSDLDRFRQEIGTDYVDVLLMHNMQAADWPVSQKPVMDVIANAREKGIVKTFGVSCHTLGALSAAADSPWVEVILTRINHKGIRMDDVPEKVIPVLQRAHKNGKRIIGMKILGMGQLMNEVDQSLKFVFGQGFVNNFTVGFQSREELDNFIDKVSAVRMS